MRAYLKFLLTGIIVLIAASVVALKYWDYVTNPWTRNGQVRAQVIQITPRVSGPLVKLPVKDNQLVKAGDLLFEIDPRTFEADLDQARANLDNTRDQIEALAKQVDAAQADVEAADATIKQAQAAIQGYAGRVVESNKEYKRQKTLDKQGATSKTMVEKAKANCVAYVNQKANAEAQLLQMQASLSEAIANLAKAKADLGAPGDQNAQVRAGQSRSSVSGAESRIHAEKGARRRVRHQPESEAGQPGRREPADHGAGGCQQLLGYRVFQGKLHRGYSQGRPGHHHPHELSR